MNRSMTYTDFAFRAFSVQSDVQSYSMLDLLGSFKHQAASRMEKGKDHDKQLQAIRKLARKLKLLARNRSLESTRRFAVV